jgi:polyisoprenyl-phosphate glycosyltransferase
MNKKVTILIPAYNEELDLPKLFARLVKLGNTVSDCRFEFLFVNDGSTDKTLTIIKDFAKEDKRVSYINLSRNFGKEVAMIAGIDHVDSDALVIIDADLQDPPELIPDMIRLWREGYDDVYARRTERVGESWLKRTTSSLFYKILQRSTRIPIQRETGDFRLLDRRCVEALQQLRERERYTKGLFSWIGYSKREITYVRDARAGGETKWNYFRLLNLAIDGIVSFTTAPLRFSTALGMIISLFAFGYIVYLVVRTLLFGSDLAGYPSIMAVVLFLGGVQLLSLGIIGEYIGRIFNETKRRPLYLIDEYHATKGKQ